MKLQVQLFYIRISDGTPHLRWPRQVFGQVTPAPERRLGTLWFASQRAQKAVPERRRYGPLSRTAEPRRRVHFTIDSPATEPAFRALSVLRLASVGDQQRLRHLSRDRVDESYQSAARYDDTSTQPN
jgi:hypothetical protein